MKKFIQSIAFCLLCVSCSTYQMVGDITLLNNDGFPIRTWNEAIIDITQTTNISVNPKYETGTAINANALKNCGINFWDKSGAYHFISGTIQIDNFKTIEITAAERNIVERDAQEEKRKQREDARLEKEKQQMEMHKDAINELISQYHQLDSLSKNINDTLQNLSYDDNDRDYWMKKYHDNETEKSRIIKTLYEKYKYDVSKLVFIKQ